MSKSKHKKLYYVPGLVSLILVPLLFAYFGNKEIEKLDVRALEINWWHPDATEYWPFPERNYKQVILTGNTAIDKAALENTKLIIKVLYTSGDTINGIQITFQNSASYGSFVSLINYFKKEEIIYVLPYKNNLWVSNMPKLRKSDANEYAFICGNSSLDNDYHTVDDFSLLESISLWHKANLTGIEILWPTIALLFLLATITITQAIRHLRKNTV